MVKNMVIFGPPGSGKGTQISEMKKYLPLTVIASGDIARSLAKKDKAVAQKMHKGELIEDELIFGELEATIAKIDQDTSLIFDGFPRNLDQTELLNKLLFRINRRLDKAIYIYLDEEEVIKRLAIRKVCEQCGRPLFSESKCPDCGGKPTVRGDDNESTIIKRMQVFLDKTAPLIEYYGSKNILVEIDGKQSIEKVAEDIKEALLEW